MDGANIIRTGTLENISGVIQNVEDEIDILERAANKIRMNELSGGRELALAITNLQQGLLWLKDSKSKI
jgi:ribosomal protein S6